MISLVLVIVSIALGVFGFIAVFNDWFIPNIEILIIISLMVTLVYLFNIFKRNRNRHLELFLLLSILMYLSLIIGVWVYSVWIFQAILSAVSMLKLTLILAAVLFGYLFFVYVRTKSVFERRQGILRQNESSNKDHCKRRKMGKDDAKGKDVSLILGERVQGKTDFSH